MQGISGSYAINGTNLYLQPEEGNWVKRDEIGVDGNNRPIYPAIREFELSWGLMSTSEVKQLIDAQLLVSNTGTIVFDLPKWGDTNWTFYSYSGTFIRDVEVGAYFSEYVKDVRVTVANIRTN